MRISSQLIKTTPFLLLLLLTFYVSVSGKNTMSIRKDITYGDKELKSSIDYQPAEVSDKKEVYPFATDIISTSVIGVLQSRGNFSTLLTMFDNSGLLETLDEGSDAITLFAPPDEAFAKLPQAQLDAILADIRMQLNVSTYHIVPGTIVASDIADGLVAITVKGEDITFTVSNDTMMVNTAIITETDIEASNGLIHVIDTVLIPPSINLEDLVATVTSINATTGAPGSRFIISGNKFHPDAFLPIFLLQISTTVAAQTDSQIGSVTTDATGSFTFTLATDASMLAGTYQLEVGDSKKASLELMIDSTAPLLTPPLEGQLIEAAKRIFLPLVSK